MSSTGCPSSPCCVSNSAAPPGTKGPSLDPRVAGSARGSSADDDLAQLDSTFWSEPPQTPDLPAPTEFPERPVEASPQLPATACSTPQAPYRQARGSTANRPVQDREQDGTRNGTGGTGASPARTPSKPNEEPLFADLMELASDKLNISLSPRTRPGAPRS